MHAEQGAVAVTNREFAIQLINKLPEDRLAYVIGYIQGLNAEDTEYNIFSETVMSRYENGCNDGNVILPEEAAQIYGIDLGNTE